jgi:hypothetical protein
MSYRRYTGQELRRFASVRLSLQRLRGRRSLFVLVETCSDMFLVQRLVSTFAYFSVECMIARASNPSVDNYKETRL